MFAELRLLSGSGYSTVTVLPNVFGLTFDAKTNDVGGISFSMKKEDAAAVGVAENSVVEVRPNAIAADNMWYAITALQESQTTDGASITNFSGVSIVSWLNDAVVYPSTWPSVPTQNPDGTTATVIQGHAFENATPGFILRTLVARAVGRGGLGWLDVSTFTGPTTTGGNAWNATLTTTYDNGTGLLTVLQDLANRNMIDYRMVGNVLKVYNYGATSTMFTPDQITFRRGSTLTEQTRSVDASAQASTVLIVGDDAAIKEISDAGLLSTIGRRREKFVTQSGVSDLPTLTLLGTAQLSISGHALEENVVGVSDLGAKKPWVDFKLGDWVWLDYSGTLKNVQIQQIAATQTDANNLTIGLTLGDRITSKDEKSQLLIDNVIGTNGYGAVLTQHDKKPPADPTSVVASPTAYRDSNGHDWVKMTITWVSPTTNSDGTAMHDLDHFEVQYKVAGSSTWTASQPVPASNSPLAAFISSLPAGNSFTSQVRAVDTAGNASNWVSQSNTISSMPKVTTPPTSGSQPTIVPAIQSIKVTWNGNDSSGNPVDTTVAYAQVHVSTTSGFTPSVSTQVGTLSDAGTVTVAGLTAGTTYYAKIVIIDKSDNSSSSSSASTGITPVLVQVPDVGFVARQIGAVTTFTQGTTPTGAIAGDLWIDTANGNTIKIYNGSTWSPYQFAATALTATARQLGGITTYVQSTTPVGALTGDLWIDTTSGNNLLKQYNGTAWAAYAPAAGTLTGTVSAAQVSFVARDIGGVTTFVQGTTPTGMLAGDLWIDTANDNVLKRYSGSVWVTNQIGSGAITNGSITGSDIASNTIATGNVSFTARNIGGTTTFTQSTTPVGAVTGDLWIDTANGNVIKTYNGTSWVVNQLATTQLSGTITAAQAGFTARQIGAITTFTQGTTPSGAITNDLWIDTANGNVIKTYNGASWVTNTLTGIGSGQITATARQLGGISTYVQGTTPSGMLANDLWIDTANGNVIKQYSGTTWTGYQVGTAAIATGAVTGSLIAGTTITAANIVNGTITGTQIAASTIAAANVSFTARNIGGTTTFTQSTIPVGAVTNDLWIDTGNGNVIKTYNGAAWVTNQLATNQLSGTITSAQAGFTARNIGGITTFVQGTTPSGMLTGDIWIDTANGNVVKQYNGTTWTAYQVGTAAIATGAVTGALIAGTTITAANIVNGTVTGTQIAASTIAAANVNFTARNIGGTTTFTQGTTPVGAVTNDLWIDTANGNTIKTYNGVSWVTNTLTGIASSQITATARQLGGISTYVQGTTPSGMLTGDLWIDTANGNTIKQYNGTVWGAYQVGTAAIANNAVTAAQVANATLTGTQIAATTIAAGNIISGTLTATQIAAGTITGTNIAATTIAAGNIVSGTITTTQIAAATIVAANIASGTVTATQIAAGTITASNILSGTITGTQIAATTIAAANIVAGTITATQIAAGTITGTNIAATGTITGAMIAATTIAAGNIVAATITTSQIAAGTITGTNIAATTIAAGNIVAGTITSSQIAAGTITASNILTGTITGTQIAATTIAAANIVAGTITATQIAAGTITGTNIAATGTITGAMIAATTISASNIVAATITTTQIASGTIVAGNIAAATITGTLIAATTIAAGNIVSGTITATQIAAGTITATQIAAGTITASKLLITMGGGNLLINSNFGNGTTGYALNGGASIATDVTVSYWPTTGTSLKITSTGAINGGVIRAFTGLRPNTLYTFSAWVLNTAANGFAAPVLQVTGNVASTVTSTAFAQSTAWQRQTVTFTTDATATTVNLILFQAAAATTGKFFNTDAWQLESGDVATSYAPKVDEILPGTVVASMIAANTITAGQIAATTITAAQIVAGTITTTQIAAGTITGTNIAATGTITGAMIAATTIAAGNIIAGTITSSQIASGTITAGNILANTITAGQIAATTITAAQIVAGTITTTQIASGTIVAGNIQSATITGTQIAATTIAAANIVAGTITATQIAAGTITAANIAAGAITATMISAGTLSSAVLLSGSIKTATTGARLEMDANGLRAYNSSSSQTMGISASSGSVTINQGTLTAGTAPNPQVSINSVLNTGQVQFITNGAHAGTGFIEGELLNSGLANEAGAIKISAPPVSGASSDFTQIYLQSSTNNLSQLPLAQVSVHSVTPSRDVLLQLDADTPRFFVSVQDATHSYYMQFDTTGINIFAPLVSTSGLLDSGSLTVSGSSAIHALSATATTVTTLSASGLITANNGITIPSGKTLAANGGLTSTTIGATGLITATTITASGLITANAGVSSTSLSASTTLSVGTTSTFTGAMTAAAITASGTVTANGDFVAAANFKHGSAISGLHYHEEWGLSAQSVTTGTLTTITNMNSRVAENDFGGTPMNTTTGTWTCPGTGTYLIAFSYSYVGFVNGSRMESGITLNGTTLASTSLAWHDLTSGSVGANGTDFLMAAKKMTAGDTLNFRVLQGTGSTQTTTTDIQNPGSYISITRII